MSQDETFPIRYRSGGTAELIHSEIGDFWHYGIHSGTRFFKNNAHFRTRAEAEESLDWWSKMFDLGNKLEDDEQPDTAWDGDQVDDKEDMATFLLRRTEAVLRQKFNFYENEASRTEDTNERGDHILVDSYDKLRDYPNAKLVRLNSREESLVAWFEAESNDGSGSRITWRCEDESIGKELDWSFRAFLHKNS